VAADEAARSLEALGLDLDAHAGKPVSALSGGMLQKLLLALALAARVPLLLLDEPTANLDARARKEFLRFLAAVDRDTTILLASHRFSEVRAVADRVLVLREGRVAFDGPLAGLRRGPARDRLRLAPSLRDPAA
jgi:ABC-type multidrug transport system ATPase subunit